MNGATDESARGARPRIKVVVLEDEPLYLDLLRVALSQYPTIEIVGAFNDGGELLEAMEEFAPDVALLDIELPGEHNGIEVGVRLKQARPELGIVLLSNHKDPAFLRAFRRGATAGWSYLLKKTVGNLDALYRAVEGAASGYVVLDHELMADSRPRDNSQLSRLSPRQREILDLIAQGYTNWAIAEKLGVSIKTVENHINAVYQELQIDREAYYQPRVLAVLEYLDQSQLREML